MELTGRSAIITGASRGLGRALATAFVQAGASVLLAARDADALRQVHDELAALASTPGQQIVQALADVSRPEDCAALAERARQLPGGTLVLVNNAGVQGPIGAIDEVDWAEWADTVRINLLGTALMCRAIIPLMRARGGGKIINLSGGGATGPRPFFSAYAASKAAVVRLTETLAEELRQARVDVNAVAPGALNTRMLDEVLEAGAGKVGRSCYDSAVRQRAEGGVPLARPAALVVFLAGARSDGITGRLLSAAWDDWAALPAHSEELAGSDVYTLRRIVPQDRRMQWKCA
jgi:3-oxoacyl-[acyl-carrier protein] reductase